MHNYCDLCCTWRRCPVTSVIMHKSLEMLGVVVQFPALRLCLSSSEPCGTRTVTSRRDKWPPGWRPLRLWAVRASPSPSSRRPRNLPLWSHPSPSSTLINRRETPRTLTLQVTAKSFRLIYNDSSDLYDS